jgi:hypothetical protein
VDTTDTRERQTHERDRHTRETETRERQTHERRPPRRPLESKLFNRERAGRPPRLSVPQIGAMKALLRAFLQRESRTPPATILSPSLKRNQNKNIKKEKEKRGVILGKILGKVLEGSMR